MYHAAIYSIKLVREHSLPYALSHAGKRLGSAEDAARILADYLVDADREHFVVLLLNQKHQLIGINTVHVGSLTGSIVSMREVFKPAIAGNAAKIICAHNHPSGNANPSNEDKFLTTRLVEAGKLLDIPVVDHIIVAIDVLAVRSYVSLANMGLIP